MKKRVLFAFVATVMCAALCLTGCGKKNTGGGGDPYVPGSGFLSEDTYSTVDEAINAFLENELNCELVTVARTSEASEEEKGDLTEEEKAELKITDEQREGITSAKRYNVEFTETVFVLEDLEDEEPTPQTTNSEMTIYLLGYADGYRYFTPAPKVGDTLTKSYFDSLFDYELYKNCTITTDGTSVTDNVSDKTPGKMTITEDAFTDYYEYTNYENKRQKCYTYGKRTGTGADNLMLVYGYSVEGKTDWKYEIGKNNYGISSYAAWVKEYIIEAVAPEYCSPICLKKTADGFELRKPYPSPYDDDTLEKCSATIRDGKIVSGSWKIVMGPDSDAYSYTISDFGTTTITDIRDEVLDMVAGNTGTGGGTGGDTGNTGTGGGTGGDTGNTGTGGSTGGDTGNTGTGGGSGSETGGSGDEEPPTTPTTTSDTIEGEWYYTIENFFAATMESSGQDSTAESPELPEISADISFSIKKLTEEEKAFFNMPGESTGYDYVCLEIVKYNLADATMTEAEKAMIGEIFGEPAGDGNIYAIFPYPFVEKANGEYNDDDFGEVVTSVVYKDSKLHVVLSFGAEADWNYRALGANPDVAGTWTGTDGTDPVSVTAVTAGEGKNTMFVGKYAIIFDGGWDDMSVLFAAGDDIMIMNDCEGTSIVVTKNGPGGETTTSDTLEGEWYYIIDNALSPMYTAAGDSSGGTTPALPNVTAEYSITIAKLAEADKMGKFEGKDYAAVIVLKFNTAGLTEKDRATVVEIMDGTASLLADNNIYMIMSVVAFVAKNDGIYTDELYCFDKAEYKDNKLNIMISEGERVIIADWYYRNASAAPDVAGNWTGEYSGFDIAIEAKTTGEDKNTVAIGKYVYVPLKETVAGFISDGVMFKVGGTVYGSADGFVVELAKQETNA